MTIEKDAKRDQVWFRGFFVGPSGGGKSRASLEIASRLFGGNLPITLINTEVNRGKLYADRFKFNLINLFDDYHPERFIEALDAAEEITRGGVVILDSATHEWYGTNGVTQLASRFGDWAKARPLHQKFVDRMNAMQAHVVVCCRAKMKYDQSEVEEGGRKKLVVTMLGVGPMQDGDFQYEFNLVAMFEQKTHVAEFSGHIDSLVGTESEMVDETADVIAKKITDWCSEGEPMSIPESAPDELVEELRGLLVDEGVVPTEKIEESFAAVRSKNRGVLPPEWVAEKITAAKGRIAEKAAKEAEALAATAAALGDGQGTTGEPAAEQTAAS